MTPVEFKKKWAKYTGKESSAYQEHFNDLCVMLGHPTPVEADPSGEDFFCFQKGVIKDLELLGLEEAEAAPLKKGFADVWKKGCFGWEYKGRHKNLDEARQQLLRYRESLLNPPLLVVCDFDRFVIRTNFNGTVQVVHEFKNSEVDDPKILKLLRDVFNDPDCLRPLQTTEEITEKLAGKFAAVARSLQNRESVELEDAFTRRKLRVAQKKNLRIARFLNRVMFCFFAEDTGLLPKHLFSEMARIGIDDKQRFAESLEQLFRVMSKGGLFGNHKIRHFNGHLFEDVTVFELTDEEIRLLAEAAEADWQFIQPSIMGTLFERALDDRQRSQLGAHYTSEEDIKTLVEPVLMAPIRREWAALREEVRAIHLSTLRKTKPSSKLQLITTLQYNLLNKFVERLASLRVFDPACGSGNFLYVALRLLLDLEKEVVAFGTEIDVRVDALVSVRQLSALEINPYAFELAQVSVQIGYLQWRMANGFNNDRSPVLQNLDGFENKDALLNQTFRKKPKGLAEAQAEEHEEDGTVKVYTERAWPECDVLVGNPPFLGDKFMRRELGDEYVEELRRIYSNRIPGQSDLCCYWFEKARDLIEHGKCRRAGLLATQGIRGGANREVLKRIKETGDIFFAISEQPWILNGASVAISMVGFDDAQQKERLLDGVVVREIGPQLSSDADVTKVVKLAANAEFSFIGASMHGPFPISENVALDFLSNPNPNGACSSDVVRLWCNGLSIVKREPDMWLVDVPPALSQGEAASYEKPFEHLRKQVLPVRELNRRPMRRKNWWLLGDPQKAMRTALAPLSRYLATPRVAKHRVFVWMPSPVLATDQVIAFSREDDFFQGVLQSRTHEIWALWQCTVLGGNTPRYGPSQCFETFPFPFADDLAEPPDNTEAMLNAAKHYAHIVLHEEPPPRTPSEHRAAIAAAAKELNELRERWLNPPEWTEERFLEFPGSADGPWARYLVPSTVNSQPSTGLVRYPRLEPRDADCAAKLKKRTLTNLYNERPAWLDLAHQKLDATVAAAYGWPADLTDEQILEKLLALNLERAAEEAKAAKVKKPKATRAKHADEMI